MTRRIAIIIAGVAVLLGSIAFTKAKDGKGELTDKTTAAATNKNADTKTAGQSGQYWLGLRCVSSVPEMVRAHVEVPEDGGIFVANVLPKGPAAKAGIRRHDIIMAAGDKRLEEVADLVAVVDRSRGKEISLKILRGDKQLDIQLAPQIRPAEYVARGPVDIPPGSRWHKLGKLFDQSRPGKDGRPPLRMRFMHPGIILPPLPSGMTVTVTRKGDEPAEITVKHDGKQWTVTIDELDKLPNDIRPHVEQMIGGIKVAPPRSAGMLSPGALGEGMKMSDPAEIEKNLHRRIQKQMEAMNRKMKKLEQMAEDLRKGRASSDKPAKPELEADQDAETPRNTEK